MSDQYELAEQRRGAGNRLGGIGNPFRFRASGKAGLIGQKGLVMDTLASTNLGGSSVTTTDTTQWVTMWSINVSTYFPKWVEFALGSMHVKHSAANAVFGAALYFYDDPTGAITGTFSNPMIIDNVALPAQNAWFPLAIIGASPRDAFAPGTHRLLMAGRNYTAGTLTFIQPTNDFITAWGGPY